MMEGNCNFRIEGIEIAYQDCPYCKNDRYNFSVNPRKGVWKCWACGRAGKIREEMNITSPQEVGWIFELGKEKEEEEEKDLEWPISTQQNEPFYRFLDKRKISLQRSIELGMYSSENYAIVPFTHGYWQGRRLFDVSTINLPKYKNPPGIRPPLYVPLGPHPPFNGTTVLVEGVFDAISVMDHIGLTCMALCGKKISDKQLLQLVTMGYTKAIIMLDPDSTMYEALQLKRRLSTYVAGGGGICEAKIAALPDGFGDVEIIARECPDLIKEAIDNAF